ncbi:MAG: DUF4124 domain-containing protein [Myxococcaceae bacterium]|nr:DUF4124 domain-containing protein [Myxococcaceae bacterium]
MFRGALVLLLASQTLYKWVGRDGQLHFGDDPSKAPKGARVETTDGVPLTVMTGDAPAPAPTPSTKSSSTSKPEARSGPVTVTIAEAPADLSADDRAYVEKSLTAAASSPRLATWGGLKQSVRVDIVDQAKMNSRGSCDGTSAFGLAMGLDHVFLLAPSSAGLHTLPLPYEKTALHELGHILEHQWASDSRPRWFAEGFANYVSDFEGYATQLQVAHWVVNEGGPLPLDRAFSGGANTLLAYTIATAAVRFFIEQFGEDGVQRLFALRRGGARFDAAFEKATGRTVLEFQKLFTQHLSKQL